MTAEEKTVEAFHKWYASLKTHKASGGPAKGTISVALVLLERLKSEFVLDLEKHRAAGQSQIKGASGAAVKRILAKFGINRPFASEGGRTNRGSPGEIKGLLAALRSAGLEKTPQNQRISVLNSLQALLALRVQEYLGRQRLQVPFDPAKSTWQFVHDLLALARETGRDGAVAQYLVGAKLQLRFPQETVENNSFSTADQQLGRQGDFQVHDTCFHITVANPSLALFEKCVTNIAKGFRPYLLIPYRLLVGARQTADATASRKIAVDSIESFVSQNLEELSVFSRGKMLENFRALVETYNKRVNEVEIDKSLLLEIPPGLA